MDHNLLFCRILSLALFFFACHDPRSKENDPQPLWEKTGYLDTVNVYEFVIDPNDNLYIAGSFGIFRSTDYGNNWHRLTITSPDSDKGFLSLAIDKSGNLLAGDLYYVRKSTDQGLSWSALYSQDASNSYISTIEVFNDTIFAAQNRGNWVRSVNNGISWTTLSARSDGMEDLLKTDGILFGGSRFGGIWRSFDNGESWEGVYGCTTWPMAKTRSEYLFAATENCGILRSTDFGENWSSNGPETGLLYRVFTLSDTCLITAGESGRIYVSTDQGSTWIDKTSNFEMRSIWGIATDSQGYVYVTARSSDRPGNRDTAYVYRADISRILSP